MDLRIVTYFELCHFKIVSSHLNLRKSQFLDLDLCNFLRGFGMVDFFCCPSTQIHHPLLAPSVLIILLNKLLNRGNRNIKLGIKRTYVSDWIMKAWLQWVSTGPMLSVSLVPRLWSSPPRTMGDCLCLPKHQTSNERQLTIVYYLYTILLYNVNTKSK